MLRLKSFILIFLSFLYASAQSQNAYSFWKDDTVLRRKFLEESKQKKQVLIAALPKQYSKDYKEIYELYLSGAEDLWISTRPVTSPEVNNYLQSIVKKIIAANPELQNTDARVIFSRDGTIDASTLLDGSIAICGGILAILDNEAELAFVICHELSHYYLKHINKSIKQNLEFSKSDSLTKELKRISKQEYGAGKEYRALVRKIIFGKAYHSREDEAEADMQGFHFLKNTGYDCNAIITSFQGAGQADDSSVYKPVNPEEIFNFDEYPFRKKWIQNESVLFGAMSNALPLTQQEKDSLDTHPDLAIRIALLQDSVKKCLVGKKFLVDENLFYKIKKDFFPEITEQEFRNDNLTLNLYYSLLMLQNDEYTPTAVYSIVRDLNILYQRQKDHKLGGIEKEIRKYSADYNLLLRMVDRLRLDEIASINYYFCKKYEAQMTGDNKFLEEKRKAQKNFSEYKSN